jgi:hypothetical protein
MFVNVGVDGVAAVTVKDCGLEVPPPGFETVTWTMPAAPRVTVATIVVPPPDTVPGTLVEPKLTKAPETKFDPVKVNVMVAFAVPVKGISPLRVGVGIVIVNVAAWDVPPPGVEFTTWIEMEDTPAITGSVNDNVPASMKIVVTPAPLT